MDLDAEFRVHVVERVARLLAHQAAAKGSSSPENCNMTRQLRRLPDRSGKSAGSDMRSGIRSQPSKHKLINNSLSFVDALISPTPEDPEKKARERVEARKRRNKKQDPEEGN